MSVWVPPVTGCTFDAEQIHDVHVERLALHVERAHVNIHGNAEFRTDRRGRDAVLTRAGFGDDALFAHTPGEERLPDRVIDLVRAGVD